MREAFRDALLARGLSAEDLTALQQVALEDPAMHARAHEQFREMWKLLDSDAVDAMIEDLSEGPPPSGRAN